MAQRSEILTVYAAGLIQGVALVTFPAANAVFMSSSDYGLSSTEYGGMFVPETLMTALHELTAEYARARTDPAFSTELDYLLRDFAGRPTPLYFARRLTENWGGARVYLKREDLAHTGAH